MSSTINKLLELARADGGKENLSLVALDLNELLSEIASDVEILCEEKSLKFVLSLTGRPEVKADRIKLRELFLNLLDNAIRYTRPEVPSPFLRASTSTGLRSPSRIPASGSRQNI